MSVIETDVFIAGSGPIACTFARKIIEKHDSARVYMVEIGSQDNPIPGAHQKNSVKYQKDMDAFVNVIKGALQPVSIPPGDAFNSTLGAAGWNPPVGGGGLVSEGFNPLQQPELNLRGTAITRTVGGMATHWTCSCPIPHPEERVNCPIDRTKFKDLLKQAGEILNVNENEFEISIRHREVKKVLKAAFPNREIKNIPLAVKRRADNPKLVTWTGSNTVLGGAISNKRLTIRDETRVTRVVRKQGTLDTIEAADLLDLRTNKKVAVKAKVFIIACGAICTPQILWNSDIKLQALGRYLCEQSMTFCQVVLKKTIVDAISANPDYKDAIDKHKRKYPSDPLPIPFDDPEPQLMIGYSDNAKYHVQIHRDAFSYGDVGPRSDPRVIVDFRFFGKQDVNKDNRVEFSPFSPLDWRPGVTDKYGMPQPTFYVQRSADDAKRDQEMMEDMTKTALAVGPFLPGSYPQFMEPGLALHITGTTRVGLDKEKSVADANSRVHGFKNLWVGGNNVIPDATASNPTRTSVAYAIKAADDVISVLKST
ncbi:pyranose 2-oxidase [Thelephora ganbajun]|uniref:Pyranose 2-oxidase n=1 Tax=Thelephora ganbajun TaxID=370292 RepID=A0ACB6Z8U0_THEGA|nr:pyranose 2-oxidase [Thelephora ganbajun]